MRDGLGRIIFQCITSKTWYSKSSEEKVKKLMRISRSDSTIATTSVQVSMAKRLSGKVVRYCKFPGCCKSPAYYLAAKFGGKYPKIRRWSKNYCSADHHDKVLEEVRKGAAARVEAFLKKQSQA